MRVSWAGRIFAPVVFLSVLWLAPAQATIVEALTLEELSTNADVIALGTVRSVESHWTDDGLTIVSEVELVVERGVLAAEPGAVLQLRTLGGAVGQTGQYVAGEAAFVVGERVLVFLEWRGETLGVLGLGQGQWRVDDDEQGQAWARPQLAGLSFAAVERDAAQAKSRVLAIDAPAALEAEPLENLLQRLDALCGERP